jgi:hypothetical protein
VGHGELAEARDEKRLAERRAPARQQAEAAVTGQGSAAFAAVRAEISVKERGDLVVTHGDRPDGGFAQHAKPGDLVCRHS